MQIYTIVLHIVSAYTNDMLQKEYDNLVRKNLIANPRQITLKKYCKRVEQYFDNKETLEKNLKHRTKTLCKQMDKHLIDAQKYDISIQDTSEHPVTQEIYAEEREITFDAFVALYDELVTLFFDIYKYIFASKSDFVEINKTKYQQDKTEVLDIMRKNSTKNRLFTGFFSSSDIIVIDIQIIRSHCPRKYTGDEVYVLQCSGFPIMKCTTSIQRELAKLEESVASFFDFLLSHN